MSNDLKKEVDFEYTTDIWLHKIGINDQNGEYEKIALFVTA